MRLLRKRFEEWKWKRFVRDFGTAKLELLTKYTFFHGKNSKKNDKLVIASYICQRVCMNLFLKKRLIKKKINKQFSSFFAFTNL